MNFIDTLRSEQQVGLQEKLLSGKPLNVKLGFDPTSPDLHLGHYVVLKGAKKFQEAGHNVTIIVGDFTAGIGDPSGRNKLRPPLSEDQILDNAKTYMNQVFLILDESKTNVQRNSKWLAKMDVQDTLKLLSSITISQMLVREDFRNRFEAQTPIFMHEMVYPLMQGMDSVAIKADVELGGTDQTFNLMMGRQLQKDKKQSEQAVITFPLLVGLDGKKKMSKSLGNHIGLLDTPTDKFGKIMSIADETMWNYWSILAEKSDAEISEMQQSQTNPKDLKMDLAHFIVALFHGMEVANTEKEKFTERFSKKNLVEVEEVEFTMDENDIAVGKLMMQMNLATSVSDANRKIEQNGVKVNQEKMTDKKLKFNKGDELLIQVGKLHVKRVKLK